MQIGGRHLPGGGGHPCQRAQGAMAQPAPHHGTGDPKHGRKGRQGHAQLCGLSAATGRVEMPAIRSSVTSFVIAGIVDFGFGGPQTPGSHAPWARLTRGDRACRMRGPVGRPPLAGEFAGLVIGGMGNRAAAIVDDNPADIFRTGVGAERHGAIVGRMPTEAVGFDVDSRHEDFETGGQLPIQLMIK